MKLLGVLAYTIGCLVVGAFCAWLVLGKGDPNCKLVAIDHQRIEALQANFAHSERNNMILVSQLAEERLKKVSTLEQEVESIKALAAKVKPLEQVVQVESLATGVDCAAGQSWSLHTFGPCAPTPRYVEKSRGEGFMLWLKESFTEAKAMWKAGMTRPVLP